MGPTIAKKLFAAALIFYAACGQPEVDSFDAWRGAETIFNSEVINSHVVNAAYANAPYANAPYANAAYANAGYANAAYANMPFFMGVDYAGVTIGSAPVGGMSISNGQLRGVRQTDGAALTGAAFIGASLTGRMSNYASFAMKVDNIVNDAAFGVNWYYVSISLDSGSTWVPFCQGGVGALALQYRWSGTNAKVLDGRMFTFACDNAALAKCVKWGYDPQKTKQERLNSSTARAQSLADWHQACIRMVTADYCGDGVAHTRTGASIDIYDNLNIQLRAGTLRGTEADWATDGARCIRKTRWVNSTGLGDDLAYVNSHCPQRLAVNNPFGCGGDPNKRPDVSNYPTSNGYYVPSGYRNLLRNDSYGFLP